MFSVKDVTSTFCPSSCKCTRFFRKPVLHKQKHPNTGICQKVPFSWACLHVRVIVVDEEHPLLSILWIHSHVVQAPGQFAVPSSSRSILLDWLIDIRKFSACQWWLRPNRLDSAGHEDLGVWHAFDAFKIWSLALPTFGKCTECTESDGITVVSIWHRTDWHFSAILETVQDGEWTVLDVDDRVRRSPWCRTRKGRRKATAFWRSSGSIFG